MTVSVDIEVERRAGALALPADAVHDATGARALGAASCATARRVRQPVKLGLRGEGAVEILEGLADGRPGRARGGDSHRQGQAARVRARAPMNDWLPFEWIAAIRFLREGRLQTSCRSSLGVSIGVGVIIFMSAALAGHAGQLHPPRAERAGAHRAAAAAGGRAAAARRAEGGGGRDRAEALPALRSIDQWQKIMPASRARCPR